MKLLQKLFGYRKNENNLNKPDASDFMSTLHAAHDLSQHPDNRNEIIVVVELEAMFDHKIGVFEDRHYNFYSYRGESDFMKLPRLKAAFSNGKRIDSIQQASATRLSKNEIPTALHAAPIVPVTPNTTPDVPKYVLVNPELLKADTTHTIEEIDDEDALEHEYPIV